MLTSQNWPPGLDTYIKPNLEIWLADINVITGPAGMLIQNMSHLNK